MDEDDRTGTLTGVKVLDLSRFAPGAYCTQLLADLGAEVVKVESPGRGDGNRGPRASNGFETAHVALNRGKRSVAVDLRHDDAPAVLRRLVGWADVVVESHRPGQLDALGIGYEAMSVEYPTSSGARSPASATAARTPSRPDTTSPTSGTPGCSTACRPRSRRHRASR